MQYEGRVFRPPSEAYSLIVQVTVGCSHNRCTFCDMYKEKKFHVRKMEDVLADFYEARSTYRRVERIFLADGDALIRRTDELLTILNTIRQLFPECQRVTSYGSPKSILTKTPEELSQLAQAGLAMIYLGLESGSDTILKKVNKGETAAEIVKAGQMVKDAGMKLSVTVVNGLGGKALWKEHAIETGKALTQMKADYIGLLTLYFELDTPLKRDWQAGRFQMLSPKEIAAETLLMIENIDSEGSILRANHASNYVSVGGTLNRDKEAMIAKLKSALDGKVKFRPEAFRAR